MASSIQSKSGVQPTVGKLNDDRRMKAAIVAIAVHALIMALAIGGEEGTATVAAIAFVIVAVMYLARGKPQA
jgi:hypothetical protein